jgi:hypothetical protein
MKQTIQVDIEQIPTLIEQLNQIAMKNKDTELGQTIWEYLEFIYGCDIDSDLYFGIQGFCQRNGINLEDC